MLKLSNIRLYHTVSSIRPKESICGYSGKAVLNCLTHFSREICIGKYLDNSLKKPQTERFGLLKKTLGAPPIALLFSKNKRWRRKNTDVAAEVEDFIEHRLCV